MFEKPRWARQHYGGRYKPWHLAYADGFTLCSVHLHAERIEWLAHPGLPLEGRVCSRCVPRPSALNKAVDMAEKLKDGEAIQ